MPVPGFVTGFVSSTAVVNRGGESRRRKKTGHFTEKERKRASVIKGRKVCLKGETK